MGLYEKVMIIIKANKFVIVLGVLAMGIFVGLMGVFGLGVKVLRWKGIIIRDDD